MFESYVIDMIDFIDFELLGYNKLLNEPVSAFNAGVIMDNLYQRRSYPLYVRMFPDIPSHRNPSCSDIQSIMNHFQNCQVNINL